MEIKKRGISEEFWKGYIDINCPNSGCPGYGMDGGYLGKNPIDTDGIPRIEAMRYT